MSKSRAAVKVVPKSDDVQARSDAELSRVEQDEVENGERDSADTPVIHDGDTKPAHSNLAASQFKMRRTKAVAMPLFKLVPDVPRYFLCDGAMFTGKKVDDKKEAAILMAVTDLETGETGQIIIGAVLRELLLETYPDDAYVGKKFEICLRKRADKKYNTYDVYEVADEEA